MRTTHAIRPLTIALTVAVCASVPAEARELVSRKKGETHVTAPWTKVRVHEASGTTRVRAPGTRVDVDTTRREVRIRVPFYSGDIRW